MTPEGQRAGVQDVILMALLVVLTLWRLWPGIDDTKFHRDEARWIGNSAVLREWRHPLGQKWQDEGYQDQYGSLDESVRRRSQPPLAMYVIGLGLILQGEGLPSLGYWIMNNDTEWNVERGNMPSDAELHAARRISVFLMVLTVLLIFAVGRTLTNRVGGFLGAAIFAIHPLTLDTGTRAWSDPLLVFSLALATWLAMLLAAKPTWTRAVLLGIALGLGAATKLSPLFLAVGLAAYGLVLILAGRWINSTARTLGTRLLIVPLVAFGTLVALYPYLWVSPIRNTFRMFEFRADSFGYQAVSFPPAAVKDRPDAFRRIGTELADRFSAAGQLSEWLGIQPHAWVREIDLALAVLGLLVLIMLTSKHGLASAQAMALVLLGGQVLLILLTLRVEYARYLFPILLANAVFAGVAVGAVWSVHSNARQSLNHQKGLAGKPA